MTHVLQRLYESEINVEIGTFWDLGFLWRLGDHLNGFVAEGRAATFDRAVTDIARAAIKHYPDSEFARAACGEKVS